MSLFSTVPSTPNDPIFTLASDFRDDPHPQKVNLGIGAFRTPQGQPYPLPSLRRSARMLLSRPDVHHEYLPQDGLPALYNLSAQLQLGRDSPALPRTVTVQSISGSGAIRLGLEFLARHVSPPITTLLIPTPTWPNHRGIANAVGLTVRPYRYYDAQARRLDMPGLLADLRAAPQGSCVILHACAHNPTGADPTPQQWADIEEAVVSAGLLPMFDLAYQGFASGDLDKDVIGMRNFVQSGRDMLIAQSFAKNMGLYGERIGVLSVVLDKNANQEHAALVRNRLKLVARTMYSNPPHFGARIAAMALGAPAPGDTDPATAEKRRQDWEAEVAGMAHRLNDMRGKLVDGLVEQLGESWEFVRRRSGMFAYLGLDKSQVLQLRERFHVYMASGGRISLAGLNDDNMKYVVDALVTVISGGALSGKM